MAKEMMTIKKNDLLKDTAFVIFGGAGDLTWRKLVPALYDIYSDHNMPDNLNIIAIDRKKESNEDLRKRLYGGVKKFSRHSNNSEKIWNKFAQYLNYRQGDFDKPGTYSSLKEYITMEEKNRGTKIQLVFYMATPPSMFSEIPKYLREAGFSNKKDEVRIVVEKPIGYDLKSAKELNNTFANYFQESQIFRIDHYLGKETVQNILAFRFANLLFEPIWNRSYVDYVTITAAEDIGIGHRGEYYDKAGALRDMVQNHLMQLLCLVAMEPMVSFDANEIRNKKVDVLHAVRPILHDEVNKFAVRGQYGNGKIKNKNVVGYRDEEGVSSHSITETFVALKLFIDNWRWQGVPFYLRTGKRLAEQSTEIIIQFRHVPHQSFPVEAELDWQPARITMTIQPDEGIALRFQAKQPGPKILLKNVDMKFNYRESFTGPFPDAYETLLWDVMQNDATLFMRADQVEAAWRILMPVLEVWSDKRPTDFPNYSAGTWGPESTEKLFESKDHYWSQSGLQ